MSTILNNTNTNNTYPRDSFTNIAFTLLTKSEAFPIFLSCLSILLSYLTIKHLYPPSPAPTSQHRSQISNIKEYANIDASDSESESESESEGESNMHDLARLMSRSLSQSGSDIVLESEAIAEILAVKARLMSRPLSDSECEILIELEDMAEILSVKGVSFVLDKLQAQFMALGNGRESGGVIVEGEEEAAMWKFTEVDQDVWEDAEDEMVSELLIEGEEEEEAAVWKDTEEYQEVCEDALDEMVSELLTEILIVKGVPLVLDTLQAHIRDLGNGQERVVVILKGEEEVDEGEDVQEDMEEEQDVWEDAEDEQKEVDEEMEEREEEVEQTCFADAMTEQETEYDQDTDDESSEADEDRD